MIAEAVIFRGEAIRGHFGPRVPAKSQQRRPMKSQYDCHGRVPYVRVRTKIEPSVITMPVTMSAHSDKHPAAC